MDQDPTSKVQDLTPTRDNSNSSIQGLVIQGRHSSKLQDLVILDRDSSKMQVLVIQTKDSSRVQVEDMEDVKDMNLLS